MTTPEALEKVRKLLRMTEARGCTEAEARQAAMMAQRLMIAHKLDALDLSSPEAAPAAAPQPVHDWADPLDSLKTRQTWRGRLALYVAEANGCAVYWAGSTLKIVGTADNATAARYVYGFASREIDRMARRYSGNGRTWLNNWRIGATEGVRDSLREAREAARQERAASTGCALVVVDRALAVIDAEHKRAVAHLYANTPNLRRGSATRTRYDSGARATGQRDGRTINTNAGGARLGGGALRLKG